MKKLLLFGLVSFCALLANAQITITQSDLPAVGDVVVQANETDFTNVSPGNAGTNQTWDFSGWMNTYEDTLKFIDPSTTPYATDFPSSNLAGLNVADSSYIFFNKSSSIFEVLGFSANLGIGSGPMTFKANPPLTQLTLPSTYNTTYNDTSVTQGTIAYSFVLDPGPPATEVDSIRFTQTTTRYAIFDGWGTTITPRGTYQSLRMKITDTVNTVVEGYVVFGGFPIGWQELENTTEVTYTYSYLTNGAGSAIAEIVTDSSGMVTSAYYKVCGDTLAGIVSTTTATCGSNDGTATVNMTSGLPPYSYNWSNGQVNDTAISLAAGNYTVNVVDNLGCQATFNAPVSNTNGPVITVDSTKNIVCFGDNNGAIYLTVTGGTSPYNYAWSNSATTQDITNLAGGIYSLEVTDNTGCKTLFSDTIDKPSQPLAATVTGTDVKCFGGSDGSIVVNATGGYTGYTYTWSPSGGTGTTASGLTQGTYSVIVRDAGGCSVSKTYTLSQPANIVITDSIIPESNPNNGAIYLTVSGGTQPFTYTWNTSPAKTTEDITGLGQGTYVVTVRDANNCVKTASYVVSSTISIKEQNAGTIRIYPNPASTSINFNLINNSTIEMFDITGRRIENTTLNAGKALIDVSGYENGIYFFRINDNINQSVTLGKFNVLK